MVRDDAGGDGSVTALLIVRAEGPGDAEAIAAVHREAFDDEAEARLVDALRAGGRFGADMSLVAATAAGEIVGHVVFSWAALTVAGRSIRTVALAPLGVRPGVQRRGVGTGLVREGLRRLRQLGVEAVVVLGDPAYYRRFGFRAALAAGLASPYAGPHLQALVLVSGALVDGCEGTLAHAPEFAALTAPEPASP